MLLIHKLACALDFDWAESSSFLQVLTKVWSSSNPRVRSSSYVLGSLSTSAEACAVAGKTVASVMLSSLPSVMLTRLSADTSGLHVAMLQSLAVVWVKAGTEATTEDVGDGTHVISPVSVEVATGVG